jgi:hypothetical protein
MLDLSPAIRRTVTSLALPQDVVVCVPVEKLYDQWKLDPAKLATFLEIKHLYLSRALRIVSFG